MTRLIPNFLGTVQNGKFIPANEDGYDVWMCNLEGKEVLLTVDEKKNHRTKSQQGYYWIIVGLISQELGYDKDEVHEILTSKFLKKMIQVEGKNEIVVRSTSSLTTEEMSHYIEEIKRFAAIDLALNIPEPENIVWK